MLFRSRDSFAAIGLDIVVPHGRSQLPLLEIPRILHLEFGAATRACRIDDSAEVALAGTDPLTEISLEGCLRSGYENRRLWVPPRQGGGGRCPARDDSLSTTGGTDGE